MRRRIFYVVSFLLLIYLWWGGLMEMLVTTRIYQFDSMHSVLSAPFWPAVLLMCAFFLMLGALERTFVDHPMTLAPAFVLGVILLIQSKIGQDSALLWRGFTQLSSLALGMVSACLVLAVLRHMRGGTPPAFSPVRCGGFVLCIVGAYVMEKISLPRVGHSLAQPLYAIWFERMIIPAASGALLFSLAGLRVARSPVFGVAALAATLIACVLALAPGASAVAAQGLSTGLLRVRTLLLGGIRGQFFFPMAGAVFFAGIRALLPTSRHIGDSEKRFSKRAKMY